MCVCERERERECVCVRERVCVCVCERDRQTDRQSGQRETGGREEGKDRNCGTAADAAPWCVSAYILWEQ